jgi:hypothetical protein
MSRLVLFNFGTFQETNRFKARAISDNVLEKDATDDAAPGVLVRDNGMRTVNAVGVTTYSFYGLTPATWKRKVDDKPYWELFKAWLEKLLASPVHGVYLTGHHHDKHMWWSDETHSVDLWMETDGRLRFGTTDKATAAEVDTKTLKSECMLVVGFGCNICTASYSLHYQGYFGSAPRKPVVLGWDTTISIPRAGKSVNATFFDALNAYAASNSKVPARERLQWLFEYEPMEIVRAWGQGAYEQRKQSNRLWTHARARGKDGNFYRYEEKGGRAEPVKV